MAMRALNLGRMSASLLAFRVACRVDDALRKALEEFIRGRLQVGEVHGFGRVRGRGVSGRADVATMQYVEEGGPHLHITCVYGAEGIPSPPRGVSAPERLFTALACSEEEMEFSCDAEFRYSEGATRSVLQLPITVFRTGTVAFNDITGLEVCKRRQDGKAYVVRVSLQDDGVLAHSVEFDVVRRMVPEVGGQLLKEAAKISRQFLVSER